MGAKLTASIFFCFFPLHLVLFSPSTPWYHFLSEHTCIHRHALKARWSSGPSSNSLGLSVGRIKRLAYTESWLRSADTDLHDFKSWAVCVTMWRTFKSRLKKKILMTASISVIGLLVGDLWPRLCETSNSSSREHWLKIQITNGTHFKSKCSEWENRPWHTHSWKDEPLTSKMPLHWRWWYNMCTYSTYSISEVKVF